MIDIARNLLRIVWDIIPLPMPLRNIIFVLILTISLFWFIFRALPWLINKGLTFLLIVTEFLFTSILLLDYALTEGRRTKKLQPLWTSYFLGDIFSVLTRSIYSLSNQFQKLLPLLLQKKWFPNNIFLVLNSMVLLLTWYFQPITRTWWYSFEQWIITGESKALSVLVSPENFVINYYNYINNSQFKIAYGYLSTNFQKKSNYDDYLDWWDVKVKRVNLKDIRLISENYSSATVDVRLQYLIAKTQKLSKPEDVRLYLIWDSQNRQWLIDDSKYL